MHLHIQKLTSPLFFNLQSLINQVFGWQGRFMQTKPVGLYQQNGKIEV